MGNIISSSKLSKLVTKIHSKSRHANRSTLSGFLPSSLHHTLVQVGEVARLLLELGEGALLDDLATVEDCEARAFLDGRQSMSNHNGGAVAHCLFQGLLDESLRLLIEG